MTYTSLLSLPDEAVAATLGLNSNSTAGLRASTPKGTFVAMSNADCLSRCNLSTNSTAQAPQPNLAATSVASGR